MYGLTLMLRLNGPSNPLILGTFPGKVQRMGVYGLCRVFKDQGVSVDGRELVAGELAWDADSAGASISQ